jgi:Ca2+/Na+ antiporter
MSTRTEGRSASAERVHHRTNIWHQAAVFIGLFLSPFAGLFAAWLIHLWAAGLHIHKGPVNWDINTPRGMPTVAACIITLLTVYIAHKAWQFTDHRKDPLRRALTTSVGTIGVMFAIGVGIGPSYLWSGLFFLCAWAVAVIWSIARLDVARNDKTTEQKEDTFLEKTGLKNWIVRKVNHLKDEHGEPLATEIEFQHAPGDTVDALQESVPAFESVSASPAGLSHAHGSDRADRSTIKVMHQDPLATMIELPELPSVGASIRLPLVVGKYQNGEPVRAYLAGSDNGAFSPTSYLIMGMNRTGKTQAESVMFTDVISRRDAVILYLNKAKGLQDLRPIAPGVEAALIDDGEGTALYREAIKQVKRIISYRQAVLAMFGIHEWNPGQCWDNPPWRTEAGKRIQMERIPMLICHFGEADAILQEAPSEATYIVSKGLSTGVVTGWSLQRADATKMPTGLRFNLGTAWCFGCGDSDSAEMALSAWVVKAGAHPERWGQRKPGYFYFEGLGIEEELFVQPARGFGLGPNGTNLRDELLARNLRNAPRMAKLDRGSADATGVPGEQSWWSATAASTDELRERLLRSAPSAEPQTAPQVADDDDEEMRMEIEQEVRDAKEVEGVELYPRDPDTGERAKFEDATATFPPIPEDQQLSWEDPKPAPRDRAAALAAFAKTLDHLARREDLRDPADPTGNTVIVTAGQILDDYQYRSRPWFTAALNAMVAGTLSREECPTDVIVSAAPDLGMTAGKYRIQRPTAGHAG